MATYGDTTTTYDEIIQRHTEQSNFLMAAKRDAIRPATWFELVFPWEEPRWGRGKRRWRRTHERIRALEDTVLGISGRSFPWAREYYF